MDTPSSHTQLSSPVQIIPTFDYLIPHWSPLILNSCKSMEDTLRHWTHHTTQYLHYHTLAYTLNTLGPHEHYPPDQWYTHTQVIEQSLLPFLSQTLSMFQTILTPILQRLHPTLNHLTQTLPTVASSATPLHSLRLHTSASLNYLTYTLLSQREHYMTQATYIATSIPPHTTLPDLPHTLNSTTQHFTDRLLTGLHTILHISINEIYTQLAHSFRTLNTCFPSGISNQIQPNPPPHHHSMIPPYRTGVMHSPLIPPPPLIAPYLTPLPPLLPLALTTHQQSMPLEAI